MAQNNNTYKFRDVDKIFIRPFHQAFIHPWYHLKKGPEYPMLTLFPELCNLATYNDIKVKTYSCVKVSSDRSESSPIRSIPLFRRALTEHSAWTVLPKCRPWCTRGSVPPLGFRVIRMQQPWGPGEGLTISFWAPVVTLHAFSDQS
jgi:hypothetical protein